MAESKNLGGDSGDMTKVLQELQDNAHFVIKNLKPSHVANDTSCKHCTLTIPTTFLKEHRDKIGNIVNLRSKVCAEPIKVSLKIYYRRPSSPDTLFGNGWKDFAIRNELSVGDSLIFELVGESVFEVHVFRGTGKSTSSPKRSRERASKKRETGGGFEKQKSSVERKRDDSENRLNSMELRLTCVENRLIQMKNELVNVEKTENSWSVKEEGCQPSFVQPSFVQRLELRNVQDAVGNTCGACFEIPVGFAKTLQIKRLWLDHITHVKLQGIQEGSSVRAVTCAYKITQSDMKEFDSAARTMSGLSLGWGDFVRENGLRAGQVLVFTLVAASSFTVRELR